MKDKILKIIVLLIGVVVIIFNFLLYNFCERLETQLDSIRDKQDTESEFNSNKFKYQSDQIERVSKDIESAKQSIKDQDDAMAEVKNALDNQRDALVQELEKRQQVENRIKNIQTSLVDNKAEVDAVKFDMKGWQKDYVGVLAELEKKIDDSQGEIKSLESNIRALNIPELKENVDTLQAQVEKMANPPANDLTSAPPAPVPDQKIEHQQLQSQ